MLGSLSIEAGPFNIPVWLIAAVGGAVVAIIVERVVLRRHRHTFRYANDLLLTGIIWGFLAWKLTPIVTRFQEIVATPLRLLYYPGGTIGILVGAAAAGLGIALSLVRARRRAQRRLASSGGEDGNDVAPPRIVHAALAAVITVGFVALPVIVTRLIPVPSTTVLPAQTVEVLENNRIRREALSEIADGRPVVLVFWATWCGPCTAQMPEIQRFHDENGDRVPLLAVNLTPTESSEQAIRIYLDSAGLTVPVALDRADLLRTTLRVSATPTTIIFDADGSERVRRTGAVTASWIERRVLPLIP